MQKQLVLIKPKFVGRWSRCGKLCSLMRSVSSKGRLDSVVQPKTNSRRP